MEKHIAEVSAIGERERERSPLEEFDGFGGEESDESRSMGKKGQRERKILRPHVGWTRGRHFLNMFFNLNIFFIIY